MDESAVAIAQSLIRLNTINPPGSEADAAAYVGRYLEVAGLRVRYCAFAKNRTGLVADLEGSGNDKPLCFTGHLDTVPLGAVPWRVDPFGAEIADGKLYGRGSTDMKAGVAAIVEAVIRLARLPRRRGVKLVFTAGEETGCEGAAYLVRAGALGTAGAVVVAEPSSNRPLIGHRGALWLHLNFAGRAAHGSMPQLGENAVIKAAKAIARLENFDFDIAPHPHLGSPSLNVGFCHGGLNINSVPDRAEVGVDIRSVPDQSHDTVCSRVLGHVREPAAITRLLDLRGGFTDPDDPWIREVLATASEITGEPTQPQTAPYFTDASFLTPAFGSPPTVILGPGDMTLAHQTDEYCAIERLEQAVAIYETLTARWCES